MNVPDAHCYKNQDGMEQQFNETPEYEGQEWNASHLLGLIPKDENHSNPIDDSVCTDDLKPPNTLYDKKFNIKPVAKYNLRTRSPTTSRSSSHSDNDADPVPRDFVLDDEMDKVVLGVPEDEVDSVSLHRDDSIELDAIIDTATNNDDDKDNHVDHFPFQRSSIEISPGIEMPLRGSVETQQAIARNFTVRVNCINCTLEVNCIRDAEYILCPMCYCVSPLGLSGSTSSSNNHNHNNSVSNVELFDDDDNADDHRERSFGVGLGYVDDEC